MLNLWFLLLQRNQSNIWSKLTSHFNPLGILKRGSSNLNYSYEGKGLLRILMYSRLEEQKQSSLLKQK